MSNLRKYYTKVKNKRIPFIFGGKGCFAAGTRVDTPNGLIDIKDIKKGDIVYSYNFNGDISENIVTETFIHENEQVYLYKLWNDEELLVTPNHWVLTENNGFIEIGHLKANDALILGNSEIVTIKEVIPILEKITVYNISVENDQTYIANNIRVHNKGAGKDSGSGSSQNESPNTLFSDDMVFLLIALGEGPMYRINSNGPRDIEINEGGIDGLLNADGTPNTEYFTYVTKTGSITQQVIPLLGEETVVPQNMAAPVNLKKGNLPGIPRSSVVLQNTSPFAYHSLRFIFTLRGLFEYKKSGDVIGYSVSVRVTVYDYLGTTIINTVDRVINGKTNTEYKFEIEIAIPENKRNSNGYKFSIEKISDDTNTSKKLDEVYFQSWFEIVNDDVAYVRTGLIGYVLKAYSEYRGSIPTFTSMVKGLLCKVPSNYDQPVLRNGEIDWREVEVEESGENSARVAGFSTQSTYIAEPEEIQGIDNYVINTNLLTGYIVDGSSHNPDTGNMLLFGSVPVGTHNSLRVPYHIDRDLMDTSEPMTLEFTIKRLRTGVQEGLIQQGSAGYDTLHGFHLYINSSNKLVLAIYNYENGVSTLAASMTSTVSLSSTTNKYTIAIVRNSSNQYRMLIEGTVDTFMTYTGSTVCYTMPGQTLSHCGDLLIGTAVNSYFYGYMDEIRFSKGIARYVSSYDDGPYELTADEYTTLLLNFDGEPYSKNIIDTSYSSIVPDTAITDSGQPIIYNGIWDGKFVYAWTQNPVWILYDLLTNRTYGLGLPENVIDKYKFYKVAQYCDACDPITGAFVGVQGYADGTFRYKPRGRYIKPEESLIGLPSGTPVKERRFICDITIGVQQQVIDIITKIASTFRGILYYSGGKLTLNVDMPEEIPSNIFNETNMEADSFIISGINESQLLTGVEVTYIEPNNHYKREVIRIDDPEALKELNYIENIAQVEAVGCTRRGQAIRFAQYLLASSKYIRRTCKFRTFTNGIDLSVGDVIAISHRNIGINWGYGGKVASNSVAGSITSNANLIVEHFTSPVISNNTFTSNTYPLALRILKMNSDKVDLYLLSNTLYSVNATSNATTGVDLVEMRVVANFNPGTKTFQATNTFVTGSFPSRGDLWTLGEVDPSNYYNYTNDKLFKVTSIERDSKELVSVEAAEYISNVYIDSDTLINYVPVMYKPGGVNPLDTPPTPVASIVASPVVEPSGSINYSATIYAQPNPTNSPGTSKTTVGIGKPQRVSRAYG